MWRCTQTRTPNKAQYVCMQTNISYEQTHVELGKYVRMSCVCLWEKKIIRYLIGFDKNKFTTCVRLFVRALFDEGIKWVLSISWEKHKMSFSLLCPQIKWCLVIPFCARLGSACSQSDCAHCSSCACLMGFNRNANCSPRSGLRAPMNTTRPYICINF